MGHQKFYFSHDIDYVYKILSTYPSIILSNKKYLYKGIDESLCLDDFISIAPESFQRPSKTQNKFGNAYNLLIDNLGNWSEYPKRSNSVILTSSATTARKFGTCYSVFPMPNSKIAICPDTDIWYSFRKSLYKIGLAGKNLDSFNLIIQDIIHWIKADLHIEYDWSFLIDVLSNIPEYSGNQDGLSPLSNIFLRKVHDSGTNILDLLELIFDPVVNGFKIIEWPADYDVKNSNDNEVWTNCECLLIKSEKLNEIIEDIL